MTNDAPRRGWREPIDAGIYRSHRVGCASSEDHKPGRRCACPYSVAAPTGNAQPRWFTVEGSLADARKARAKALGAIDTVSAPRLGNEETLRSFAARWLRTRSADLRPATMAIYDRAYRVRVDPHLGTRRLEELTRSRVQEWVAKLIQSDPSRRSVEQAVETLSSMLTAAVHDGLLPSNPAKSLKMPRPPAKKKRAEIVLTRKQAERMITKEKSLRNATMLRAMLEAGLRRGETIGLRWPQVDLAARRIVVNRSVWQGPGGVRIEHLPKGGSEHVAAITEDLAGLLSAWLETSVVNGGADADGLVWPGRDGRALAVSTVAKIVTRAQKRAGVVGANGKVIVSPHGLRHTAASTALEDGVSLLVVSRQLGHGDQIVTARHYSHLLGDEQLDAFANAQGDRSLRDTLREAPKEAERPCFTWKSRPS